MEALDSPLEVTVLLPCLNEAETVGTCVRKAMRSLRELGVDGEVLVSDNGSSDGSQAIAEAEGARVVHAPVRGYGGALIHGIQAARGRYVIMADSDDSYDLANLAPFVAKLREGHDLVIGNRYKGGFAKGASPFLHQYFGIKALSWAGRALFGFKGVGDFHCGIRGFDRDRFRALGLCMPGMEFASELVVRAQMAGYSIVEVPTTLAPAGRTRAPHLNTWRDGWRHLRFLLVLSPGRTLLWPGVLFTVLGLAGTATLTAGPVSLGSVRFDVSALVYACLMLLVGVMLVLFCGCAKIYGRTEGLVGPDRYARWQRFMSLEVLITVGLVLIAGGTAGTVAAVANWNSHDFGDLDPRAAMRVVVPSATAIALGVIVAFTGLLASLLSLRAVHPTTPVREREDTEPVPAGR